MNGTVKKNKELQVRFTGSATKEQMAQMDSLVKELRWSRSKIIRLAINLMFKTHRADPQKYGM